MAADSLIYLDTSVVLAYLFAEDRRPPQSLWDEPLISSRLLHYEIWTRVHARGLAASHGEHVRQVLARIDCVELTTAALARASEPFPHPVRTLDAIHLSTIEFLRDQQLKITLASYDERMNAAARAMGIPCPFIEALDELLTRSLQRGADP